MATTRENNDPAMPVISRIVVTFAGAGGGGAVLDAAALAARALGADLHGLYIREQALRDLGALAFTAVIGPGGTRTGTVTADTVEHAWRREELRCRRQLERARQEGIPTFNTVSGEYEKCLCATAGRRDLIALAGRPAEMAPDRLAAAVRTAAHTAGAVMVGGVETTVRQVKPGPVLAIDDGDAMAGKAVTIAARLAAASGRGLAVLTTSGAATRAARRPVLEGRPYDLHLLPFWTERDLIVAVDRIAPSLAVADLESPGLSATALADRFLRSIRMPLILIGGTGPDEAP